MAPGKRRGPPRKNGNVVELNPGTARSQKSRDKKRGKGGGGKGGGGGKDGGGGKTPEEPPIVWPPEEPDIKPDELYYPDWLEKDKEVLELFVKYKVILSQQRVVKAKYSETLAEMCLLQVTARRLMQEARRMAASEDGLMVKDANGAMRGHPIVRQALQLHSQAVALAKSFGLLMYEDIRIEAERRAAGLDDDSDNAFSGFCAGQQGRLMPDKPASGAGRTPQSVRLCRSGGCLLPAACRRQGRRGRTGNRRRAAVP